MPSWGFLRGAGKASRVSPLRHKRIFLRGGVKKPFPGQRRTPETIMISMPYKKEQKRETL